jgi:hypothetical protein
MSGQDFEIGTRKFKLLKLDAFKQFHIVRRIGPMLADLLPALGQAKKIAEGTGLSETDKLSAFAEIAAPLMKGLSKLTDADADLVLMGLLSAAEMQQPAGNWARVASGNMLMIQDLELPQLLQIAGRAFAFNLSGFFSALPQK